MGEPRGTSLHYKNYFRIPYPFHFEASASNAEHVESQKSHPVQRRNGPDNRKNETRGSIGQGQCEPKFPVLDVSGAERRRQYETHIQSKGIKPLCVHSAIQIDKCVQNSRFSTTERLDGKNRYFPGVFPHTHIRSPSSVSTPNLSTGTSTNELPTFWTKFCSENLCLREQLDGPDPSPARHPPGRIFGRLFASQSGCSCSKGPHKNSSKSTGVLGVENKLRQISCTAMSNNRIPWNNMGLQAQPKVTSCSEVCQAISNDNKLIHKQKGHYQGLGTSDRPDELCQLHCPTRQAKLPTATAIIDRLEKKVSGSYKNVAGRGCSTGTTMVANSPQGSISGSPPISHSLCCDRRLRCSVGSANKQSECNRNMVVAGKGTPLQSKGVTCHFKNFRRSMSEPSFRISAFTMRQQNSCILLEKRRRYQVAGSTGNNVQDIHVIGQSSDNIDCLPHSRGLQCRGRSPISISQEARVASAPSGYNSDFRQMGNPSHRLVCLPPDTSSSQILFPGLSRSASGVSRCDDTTMELRAGVGIPPAIFDAQSVTTPEHVSRDVPHCSPQMGTSILETRSKKPSHSSTVDHHEPEKRSSRRLNRPPTTESDRNDAGGVEMWGWQEHLVGWTKEQKDLLLKSWRPSTIRTYKPVWTRWVNWARENKISTNKPSGSDLSRFLADLHQKEGLSYSTILTHKSVVSTFCDPQAINRLSDHPMVKRILKSIALAKPNVPKPPVWDIDKVINHLATLDPKTDNLYEISKCTATMLLLCSGRRVHDLTLLRVDSNHCIDSQDSIVLWPVFGSKTDTVDYRQSGWKLKVNTNNRSLCPVHWVRRLIIIGQQRRSAAESSHLFLSICGKAKPATRCIIARWVKNILKESGIEATAGSFRSAVASKSWLENAPIEEILTRGNWRSENTFKRFYCRQIMNVNNVNNTVSDLFNAVVP